MSISARVEGAKDKISVFLDTPGASLLVLRSSPEQLRSLAQIVASFKDDPASEYLFFPAVGGFADPASFWKTVEASILEEVAQAAELGEPDDAIPRPRGVDWDGPLPFGDPERRLGAWLEALTREFVQGVAVVVLLESVAGEAVEALVTSLSTLAGHLSGSQVRLLLLDATAHPLLESLAYWPDRRRDRTLTASAAQTLELIEALLGNPGPRVLGIHAGASGATVHLRQALTDPEFQRSFRFEAVWVEAAFDEPLAWYDAAEAAIRAHGETRSLSPMPLPECRTAPGLEPAFAEYVEQVARRWLPDGRTLVLAFAPTTVQVPRALSATLSRLQEAATTPAVRYLMVDPGLGVVGPAADPTPEPVPLVDFVVTADDLEQEAQAKADDQKSSPLQRLRHTSMLASFALSRLDFPTAVARCSDAIRMADEMGDGEEQGLAWLNLGYTAYRMEDYEPARNAFTQAATLSLDHQADGTAAAALTHLGHSCYCLESYDEAVQCYENAQRYHHRLGNAFGCAHALTWLAETRRALKQQWMAEEAFLAALEIYELFPDPYEDIVTQGRIEVYQRLARFYDELGCTEDAADVRRLARDLGGAGIITEHP
jgi:hypothetical protein